MPASGAAPGRAEYGYRGTFGENHSVLPGVTGPQIGTAGAEEHGLGEGLAVDGVRDGLPQLAPGDPARRGSFAQ